MHTPACILVVDDLPHNVDILKTRLAVNGYEILTATSGKEALAIAATEHPDLILLDLLMPEMDGLEVCRRLKENASLPFIPVIIVTVKSQSQDIIAGFEAGAEEYLTKPLDQAVLVPRVESMLRLKALYDIGQGQITELEDRVSQLQSWNEVLQNRLEEQAADLERLGELKQFLPRQLAELVLSSGRKEHLGRRRQEVTILCGALRELANWVETDEINHVSQVLSDAYQVLGQLMVQFEGSLDYCSGDRFIVIFNGPLPCSEPELRAVRMAVALRHELRLVLGNWRRENKNLDFGMGIARGPAMLSQLRFEGRAEYTVVGPVQHLASRLCEEARGEKILISHTILEAVNEHMIVEPVTGLDLKAGELQTSVFEVTDLKGTGIVAGD